MRRTAYTPTGLKRLKCCRCEDNAATDQQYSPVTQRWYPLCTSCYKFIQRLIFMFVEPNDYANKEDTLQQYYQSRN